MASARRQTISAYDRGIMGSSTRNVERIATEGALFTDAYAQQSCTVGRASFILSQQTRVSAVRQQRPGLLGERNEVGTSAHYDWRGRMGEPIDSNARHLYDRIHRPSCD
jgi:arylsulfatase A-like enzyme